MLSIIVYGRNDNYGYNFWTSNNPNSSRAFTIIEVHCNTGGVFRFIDLPGRASHIMHSLSLRFYPVPGTRNLDLD